MGLSMNKEILLVAALFCVALFFATYHLTESPPVWYDEGFYVQSAANLAEQGHLGLQFAPGTIAQSALITVGYPLIYPLALWFQVFGADISSARFLMVVFILGFLAASYVLARRLFGAEYAFGTLALLATFPPLYGNGKSVLGEVPGLFYLVVFLACFTAAQRHTGAKRYAWLVAAGLLAGLCVATKPTFLLLLPAIALGAFLEWRRDALTLKELSVAALAGLAPISYWFVSQFGTNDSLFYVLANYANPYQIQDMLQIIWNNLWRLFADVGSLYLVVLIGIWVSALVIRIRTGMAISSVEVIAFVFALLTIGNYARTTGWYRYLFEAQIVSLLFLPNALSVMVGNISRRAEMLVPKFGQYIPSSSKVVFATVILLSVLGGYQTLFNSWVAEAYQSRRTAFWEAYFEEVSSATSFFFYNTPEVAFFSESRNYYQYLNPYEIRGIPGEGWPIGEEQLAALGAGIPDKVIVRSSAYKEQELFKAYEVSQETYQYTILSKKPL